MSRKLRYLVGGFLVDIGWLLRDVGRLILPDQERPTVANNGDGEFDRQYAEHEFLR